MNPYFFSHYNPPSHATPINAAPAAGQQAGLAGPFTQSKTPVGHTLFAVDGANYYHQQQPQQEKQHQYQLSDATHYGFTGVPLSRPGSAATPPPLPLAPPSQSSAPPPPSSQAPRAAPSPQPSKRASLNNPNSKELSPPAPLTPAQPATPASAIPCLVLFSPQGQRPLEGLTATSTLAHRSSVDGGSRGRAGLQPRTLSANRLPSRAGSSVKLNEVGVNRRGSPALLDGVRCVYDRDTRSQLLHIAPGTEVDFSTFMRLPGSGRGLTSTIASTPPPTPSTTATAAAAGRPSAGRGAAGGSSGAGRTILAIQFCVAAPVWPAAERHRAGGLTTQPPASAVPAPGTVYIELVVRTTTTTTATTATANGSSGAARSLGNEAEQNKRTTPTTGVASTRGGYRLRFTNAVHEVQRHVHHTRFPLRCVRTAQWVQLYLDVDSILHHCALQAAGEHGLPTALTSSAVSVVRLQHLRIGAGAAAAAAGGAGSGGLYVRRIVAGHNLPLPQPEMVEYVTHAAGHYSVGGADLCHGLNTALWKEKDREALTRGVVSSSWTLPEPLRLPAEAGETLSLFVRTGDEAVLRVPPAPAPPSHVAENEEEEVELDERATASTPNARGEVAEARKQILRQQDPQPKQQQQQHRQSPQKVSHTPANASSASRGTTPAHSTPMGHTRSGQKNRARQGSHTPLLQSGDVHHDAEKATDLTVPAPHPLTSAANSSKKPFPPHPTALELLRIRQQHQQAQEEKSRARQLQEQKHLVAMQATASAAAAQPRSSWSSLMPPNKKATPSTRAEARRNTTYDQAAGVAPPPTSSSPSSSRSPSAAEVFMVQEAGPRGNTLGKEIRANAEDGRRKPTRHGDADAAYDTTERNFIGSGEKELLSVGEEKERFDSRAIEEQQTEASEILPDLSMQPPSEESFVISEPSQVELAKRSSKSKIATASQLDASSRPPSALADTRVPVEPVSQGPIKQHQTKKSLPNRQRGHVNNHDADIVEDGAASLLSMASSSAENSSVASSMSSVASSFSCTSAVVELMREMNARVSRLHAVLAEERQRVPLAVGPDREKELSQNPRLPQAAPLPVPDDVQTNADTSKSASNTASFPAVTSLGADVPRAANKPSSTSSAVDVFSNTVAVPTGVSAAAAVVDARSLPANDKLPSTPPSFSSSPQEGVRATLPPVPRVPVRAAGAATPLSLLSAVIQREQQDAASQRTVSSPPGGNAKENESVTCASPQAADDARAVLEMWSSTEMPLQLPDFAPQPSRPPSRQQPENHVLAETVSAPQHNNDAARRNGDGRVPEVRMTAWRAGPLASTLSTPSNGQVKVDEKEEGEAEKRSEKSGAGISFLPPGSTATSWTFHSAPADPRATVTTLNSSDTPLGAFAVAAPLPVAGALPRTTREDRKDAANVHNKHPSMRTATSSAAEAETEEVDRANDIGRLGTKAVVWRRSAAAADAVEGGSTATQRETTPTSKRDSCFSAADMTLEVGTPVNQGRDQQLVTRAAIAAAPATDREEHTSASKQDGDALQVQRWPLSKLQDSSRRAELPPAHPATLLSIPAAVRDPNQAANASSQRAQELHPAHATKASDASGTDVVVAPEETLSTVSRAANGMSTPWMASNTTETNKKDHTTTTYTRDTHGTHTFFDAGPASHHSFSTVSSFHMWLPGPAARMSAGRGRYPSVTTPSSGGGSGSDRRSSDLLRTPAREGHTSAVTAVSAVTRAADVRAGAHLDVRMNVNAALENLMQRAAPPSVRLSATGNAPFAATATAPSHQLTRVNDGDGGRGRGADDELPIASAAPQADDKVSGDGSISKNAQPLKVTPKLAALCEENAAEKNGLAEKPAEATRFIYDSVLHCYLDTETNAYVEKIV